MTFVNWAVDPAGQLPMLPRQLPIGPGDESDAVEAHDAVVRHDDAAYTLSDTCLTLLCQIH